MNGLSTLDGWSRAPHHVFWGEIAPCEHVVQIYENDEVFLDLLHGFVAGGVAAEDCVIVLATRAHLQSLGSRLEAGGLSVEKLVRECKYLPCDADEALSSFMVSDWPDENLFNQMVSDLITKAKGHKRQVRAFGEMVALLWARGQVGATVRLEHLWNKFCENEAFCLFCAYPRSGFTQDAAESVMHICSAHSRIVGGGAKGGTDIFYKPMDQQLAS